MAARRLADTLCRSLVDDIHKCSLKKQTGVSLKYMMDFGSYPSDKNLMVSAHFLHKELPVRLAHRVIELENLPYGLSEKSPVLKVRDWYVDSFKDLRNLPEIQDAADERKFTELIHQIKIRHNNVTPTIAMGVQELKEELGRKVGLNELPEIHQFLDRFYMSRIGIRMLIGQHVALHQKNPPPGYIGLISTRVSPVLVSQNAIDDARSACMRTYGSAPEVHIYGDPNFSFAYVPTHLHQMVFELLKNSLRAVQERFADSDQEAPPIRVVVADGIEDITVKISDEGGGIPRSGLPKIWTYLYTTAKSPLAENRQMQETPTVMAGYGYGLPISRLYARYFGGDLQVISMEGYGAAFFLYWMALVSAPPKPAEYNPARTLSAPIRIPELSEVEQHQNQKDQSGLLSVGFNQDYGCFACGTTAGFRIYNCEPFKETFRREFSSGGIGLVEMLFRCNILAIVGGGSNLRYPPNKVMIWDDHQSRCIGELAFRSDVRAVRLRRDRIVVALEHKIYVYNFSDLKLLHQIETIGNLRGLCELSPTTSSMVLACPGLRKGQVRVELYGTKKTRFIAAHDSYLACISLTLDGQFLATASIKGTLVRVFNTMDGSKLQEVRRGSDRADIYSIAFSLTAQWLVVSSDKGTIHVFSLKVAAAMESDDDDGDDDGGDKREEEEEDEEEEARRNVIGFASANPGSTLSFMRGVLPRYFSSEWSFAQFHLPEECRCVVSFSPQKKKKKSNTVVVVSAGGSFYRCSFDPVQGGEMVQQEYAKFF